MSEKHVRELDEVYSSIFQDAGVAFPTLRGEFEKDLNRLLGLTSRHGLRIGCVEMPAIAKHLDRCLDNGQYSRACLPLTKRFSPRTVLPKFLRELHLLVFSEAGKLKEDYNVEAIYFIRQIYLAGKKITTNCSAEQVKDEVLDFIRVDDTLPTPPRTWGQCSPSKSEVDQEHPGFRSSDHFLVNLRSFGELHKRYAMSSLLRNLDIVSGILSTTLGPYRPSEWRFRHGPGAISERTGATNKYSWSNWSERLEVEFPIADYGFHSYAAWGEHVDHDKEISSHEPHSRLIDVPKSYLKPRLIAAEPSEHQWCQQNLLDYFCSRIEGSWISKFICFTDQTRNQDLALRGSLDGSLTTLDLSSASDRVSCLAVGNLFRGNYSLLRGLQATRTRWIQYTQVNQKPELLELKKFSTMGSACTFPVQSIMFLCVALAAVLTTRGRKVTLKNIVALSEEVAVFGDDLVIPTDCRELVFAALEVLDFKINADKTYYCGKFRESCGVDAFAGVRITPAYWKGANTGTPEALASTVEVSNNFYKKFMLYTSAKVASTIRKVEIPIVSMASGVLGLRSFVRPTNQRVKRRWNRFLQRTESLVPTLLVSAPRTRIKDDSAILQYFTEAPSPFQEWEGGVQQRARPKLRMCWVASEDLVT